MKIDPATPMAAYAVLLAPTNCSTLKLILIQKYVGAITEKSLIIRICYAQPELVHQIDQWNADCSDHRVVV